MVKKLKFSKIDLVERTGALMLVSFLDDDGNMYQWAPKWADVEQIFLKQINVERFNKPESEWLNKFAKTAQDVVEGAQRIKSARKISGRFESYLMEQLVIRKLDKGCEYVTPAFDVSLHFLDEWLNSDVDVFVLNDMVIRLRRSSQDENFQYHFEEYPPTSVTS